jgi:hypothetical protein
VNERQRRIEAIRRALYGEAVTKIVDDLDRTRPWFYKWWDRFEQNGVGALVDQRQDNDANNESPEWLQTLIVQTRDRLVKQAQQGNTHKGIGARQIVRELEELEIEVPHWRTAHRILQRADRIPQPQQEEPYCPRPPVDQLNAVHQVDIWPRFLQGGQRLYFFHLVDVACWYPHGLVSPRKTTDMALAFLVESWQKLGLPDIAQFDNEMTFTGGRWAHRLGRVVRLCLAFGVQVWFIPLYDPKRNGYVENFHGQCDQFFWSRTIFETKAQVEASYPDFLTYFRQQRRLPAIDYHTPSQMRSLSEVSIRYLPASCHLHQQDQLPLVAGLIHCVRLADQQGQVTVLNRSFSLDPSYAHQYIWAQVDTAHSQVTFYHQPEAEAEAVRIETASFPLAEPVCDFNPNFDYPI